MPFRFVPRGEVPHHDHAMLRAIGTAAIFGPGTKLPPAGREVMRLLDERTDHAA